MTMYSRIPHLNICKFKNLIPPRYLPPYVDVGKTEWIFTVFKAEKSETSTRIALYAYILFMVTM